MFVKFLEKDDKFPDLEDFLRLWLSIIYLSNSLQHSTNIQSFISGFEDNDISTLKPIFLQSATNHLVNQHKIARNQIGRHWISCDPVNIYDMRSQ